MYLTRELKAMNECTRRELLIAHIDDYIINHTPTGVRELWEEMKKVHNLPAAANDEAFEYAVWFLNQIINGTEDE